MCRNHSHIRVETIEGAVELDGTVLTIAELQGETVTLENVLTGGKFIPPPCALLLLLSPTQETPYYSLHQWTEAFSALRFAMAAVDRAFGEDTLPTSNKPSGK